MIRSGSRLGRVLGVLLALGVLVGLAAWWKQGHGSSSGALLPHPPSVGERAPARASTENGDHELDAERALDTNTPTATAREDPSPLRADPEAVRVDGLAVRVDRAGVEHAGEDGSLSVAWWHHGALERRELEIVGGRWFLDATPDIELYVDALTLGARAVQPEQDRYTIPLDRRAVIRGLEASDVLLHVVAAEDGKELENVELWFAGAYLHDDTSGHPGVRPKGPPTVRGTSPLLVPADPAAARSPCRYWAIAPGRAFGVAVLDHSAEGERTVALQREASLEIELLGNAAWLKPKVRLWPPDASQFDAYAFAELEPDAEDRALFESLAPGPYLASVERGWADRRRSFGQANVDVVAGERLRLRIALDLPEQPRSVPIAGTLLLPAGWERENVRLVVGAEGSASVWMDEPIETAVADMQLLGTDGSASRILAWRANLPAPGTYRVEVEPLLVREAVEVPAGGLSDIDLVVPPPADVEVKVIDASSGEEIEVSSLYWSVPSVDGILATAIYSAVADPRTRRVSFRAPAMPIALRPREFSIQPVDEEKAYTLDPGSNILELLVYRQIGLYFTFTDGEASVPWNWDWRLSVSRVDGEARDVARSIGVLWVREPGSYVLSSQGIPGYESIEGMRIEVPEGAQRVEVRVPLVAER
jgi:hypothetical protein